MIDSCQRMERLVDCRVLDSLIVSVWVVPDTERCFENRVIPRNPVWTTTPCVSCTVGWLVNSCIPGRRNTRVHPQIGLALGCAIDKIKTQYRAQVFQRLHCQFPVSIISLRLNVDRQPILLPLLDDVHAPPATPREEVFRGRNSSVGTVGETLPHELRHSYGLGAWRRRRRGRCGRHRRASGRGTRARSCGWRGGRAWRWCCRWAWGEGRARRGGRRWRGDGRWCWGWRWRCQEASALGDGRVGAYRQPQQFTLDAQPEPPRYGCSLAGDGLALQAVDVHEVLGYLQLRLECGYSRARHAQRQSLQVVQAFPKNEVALIQRGVHLLAAPAERPLAPGAGERGRRPLGRWRRSGGSRGRGCHRRRCGRGVCARKLRWRWRGRCCAGQHGRLRWGWRLRWGDGRRCGVRWRWGRIRFRQRCPVVVRSACDEGGQDHPCDEPAPSSATG